MIISQGGTHLFKFQMLDSTSKQPVPGKSVTVLLHNDRGWFMPASLVPNFFAQDIGNGWYAVQLLPADLTYTAGDTAFHPTAVGCEPGFDYKFQVKAPEQPPVVNVSPPEVNIDQTAIINLLQRLVAAERA